MEKSPIDFKRLGGVNQRAESLKYLRWFIRHHRVSKEHPEDWMIFAAQIEAQYGSVKEDDQMKELWKEVYKSLIFSENKLKYSIHKGHVLLRLAMTSLIAMGDLDITVSHLKKSYNEDKIFFQDPTLGPAYKMLSFLEPLLAFKTTLWPSEPEPKREIANRLYILMGLTGGTSVLAFKPELITDMINGRIQDEALKKIMLENTEELLEISELCDKNKKFYKSMMFLIANILEGFLYNIYKEMVFTHSPPVNLEKESISGLAHLCQKAGAIPRGVEYMCRFIQSYRDFIHPARNKHHTYRLDSNFNKMFLMFFMLLVNDLVVVDPHNCIPKTSEEKFRGHNTN